MLADAYQDFSDDSGSIPHACSQPYAFAVCRAHAFCCCRNDWLAVHWTGSAHLPLVPRAPFDAGIWCCPHSLIMLTAASHLTTPNPHMSYAFANPVSQHDSFYAAEEPHLPSSPVQHTYNNDTVAEQHVGPTPASRQQPDSSLGHADLPTGRSAARQGMPWPASSGLPPYSSPRFQEMEVQPHQYTVDTSAFLLQIKVAVN